MAFVGAVVQDARLAFGLGERETAGQLVQSWYQNAQQNRGQIARSADLMERRTADNAASFNDASQQWRPNPADRRHDSEGG